MSIVFKIKDKFISRNDTQKVLAGKILTNYNATKESIRSLEEVEFKVFSQWGDDGIIQYLINTIKCTNKTFIEFGVEDYYESNTRFLLTNNNWTGLVLDGSSRNIASIQNQSIYWKYNIRAVKAFITKENINQLIINAGFSGEIGILSIDIDGNDFWILDSINTVTPDILIVEYNSVFGIERTISIPYQADFYRTKAHYSNLYWGASLSAFNFWAIKHGYTLIGCNSNGNNAYFVRNDRVGSLPTPTLEEAFISSMHRESRDKNGKLNYISGKERIEIIRGMDVTNLQTGKIEKI